jgi:hypothetical protein
MRLDTFYSLQNRSQGSLPNFLIEETGQGMGVRAACNMNAGEVLCNISGPSIGYTETVLMGRHESYCLQVGINKYIKPCYPFYLFNHSCEPNCGINEHLQLITLRGIEKNEQLCWDYSTSMLERGWEMKCSCKQTNCRGVIKDFDKLPGALQQYYLDQHIVLPYIREYLSTTGKLTG